MTPSSGPTSFSRVLVALLVAGATCPSVAQDTTYGFANDVPVVEAVAQFNADTHGFGGSEPSGRGQPPLTVDELLAAVWARLVGFRPLPPDVAATYRGIVKTRILPKGSLLDVSRGHAMSRPGGDCKESPVDVHLWKIELYIWLDRFPREVGMESPADPLLVRLQHINAAPAVSKGFCEGSPPVCADPAAALARVLRAGRSWEALYDHRKSFPGCDDGAIAEGYSDSVARLLANAWERLPELSARAKRDGDFLLFILRHVDASAAPADLKRTLANARTSCPSGLRELCKKVEAAAAGALEEARTQPKQPRGER
jgi:hypothetical protein